MSRDNRHKSLNPEQVPAYEDMLRKREASVRLWGVSLQKDYALQSADSNLERIRNNVHVTRRHYEAIWEACELRIVDIDMAIEDVSNRMQNAYDESMESSNKGDYSSARKYSSEALSLQKYVEVLEGERSQLVDRVQFTQMVYESINKQLADSIMQADKAYTTAENSAVMAKTNYRRAYAEYKEAERSLKQSTASAVVSS